jgi:hypothetical protein
MGRVNIHPELSRSWVTRFHTVPAPGNESSYGSLVPESSKKWKMPFLREMPDSHTGVGYHVCIWPRLPLTSLKIIPDEKPLIDREQS